MFTFISGRLQDRVAIRWKRCALLHEQSLLSVLIFRKADKSSRFSVIISCLNEFSCASNHSFKANYRPRTSESGTPPGVIIQALVKKLRRTESFAMIGETAFFGAIDSGKKQPKGTRFQFSALMGPVRIPTYIKWIQFLYSFLSIHLGPSTPNHRSDMTCMEDDFPIDHVGLPP